LPLDPLGLTGVKRKACLVSLPLLVTYFLFFISVANAQGFLFFFEHLLCKNARVKLRRKDEVRPLARAARATATLNS